MVLIHTDPFYVCVFDVKYTFMKVECIIFSISELLKKSFSAIPIHVYFEKKESFTKRLKDIIKITSRLK